MPKEEIVKTALDEAEALLEQYRDNKTVLTTTAFMRRLVEEARRHERRAEKYSRQVLALEEQLASSGDV